jgi:hypothetical protein
VVALIAGPQDLGKLAPDSQRGVQRMWTRLSPVLTWRDMPGRPGPLSVERVPMHLAVGLLEEFGFPCSGNVSPVRAAQAVGGAAGVLLAGRCGRCRFAGPGGGRRSSTGTLTFSELAVAAPRQRLPLNQWRPRGRAA